MKLLTINNTKIRKGEKKKYLTVGLHLAPADLSGYNVCPMATKGCKDACLNTAGMGAFSTVQAARIKKTKAFFEDRQNFMLQLEKEILSWEKKAKKKRMKLVVRLNLTSDIVWESIRYISRDGNLYSLMERFPHIQFYDYTKRPIRKAPANYHITFSLAENNMPDARKALQNGLNVAVVFRGGPNGKRYLGLPVVNGDDTDLRFLDPSPSIIGLAAKGKGKKDTTGFVKEGALRL